MLPVSLPSLPGTVTSEGHRKERSALPLATGKLALVSLLNFFPLWAKLHNIIKLHDDVKSTPFSQSTSLKMNGLVAWQEKNSLELPNNCFDYF